MLQLCELLSYDYVGTQDDNAVMRNITVPIKFTGAGPQFGAQFFYDCIKGFGLSGKALAALLNGRSYNHTTYTSNSPILETLSSPNPNIQTTTVNCISLLFLQFFCDLVFCINMNLGSIMLCLLKRDIKLSFI